MSPTLASKVMIWIGCINIVGGILFAFGGVWDPLMLNYYFLDIVSSGDQGLAAINSPEAKLSMAILGGLYTGLCGVFIFITAPAIKEGDERIKKGTVYAMTIWFIVDSGASYATDNPLNIISNIGFYVMLLFPIFLVKKVSV